MSNYDLAPTADSEEQEEVRVEPGLYAEQPPKFPPPIMDLLTDFDVPPTVALEQEIDLERQQLAEKQKEAELRQTQAIERSQLAQKRQLDQKHETYPMQDLEIDQEATSEKTFDRRHEVLDHQALQAPIETHDPTGPSSLDSSPVSIAKILAERDSLSVASSVSTPLDSSINTPATKLTETYKKSLKAGFIIGLAIAAAGLIGYYIF